MEAPSTKRVDPLPAPTDPPQCVFVKRDGRRCLQVPRRGETMCGLHAAGLGRTAEEVSK